MKQTSTVKWTPRKGWLQQRAISILSVLAVAVMGTWLLTVSHADTLPCATVKNKTGKMSFQICMTVTSKTVATKVVAASSLSGLTPAKSLISVQQCDAAGNNCANIVTTSGGYKKTGPARYSMLSTTTPIAQSHKYRACAFLADSTGWTGGSCSPAVASNVLLGSTLPSTTTTTPPTSTTTPPPTKTITPPPVTTPPATTPSKPTPAQAAAAAAAAKAAAQLAAFYKAIAAQQAQANAFLTALNNMCPAPRPVLYPGTSGSCVKFLQFFLNVKATAGLAVGGSFGPGTEAAVINYQRSHGLSADGIVGNQTWTYLLTGQTVPPQTTGGGSSSGGGSGGSTNSRPPSSGGGDPSPTPRCYSSCPNPGDDNGDPSLPIPRCYSSCSNPGDDRNDMPPLNPNQYLASGQIRSSRPPVGL